MAKRYHQNRRDRRDERMAMDRERMRERDPMMSRGRMDGYEMTRRMYDNSDPMPTTVNGLEGRRAYKGNKESRRMIARDGAMISEDMTAPALMPQRIIESYWPRSDNNHMGYVDDLFYGVQKQMHEDYDDLGRELGPKKY